MSKEMTKTITDIAREAGFEIVGVENSAFQVFARTHTNGCVTKELERFAALQRAEIIKELCAGVEMPEPVAYRSHIGDGRYYFTEQNPKEVHDNGKPCDSLVTTDQYQEGIACAVARTKSVEELLWANIESLSGAVAKKDAEITQISEALRQHGLTLVKTATGYDVMKLAPVVAY